MATESYGPGRNHGYDAQASSDASREQKKVGAAQAISAGVVGDGVEGAAEAKAGQSTMRQFGKFSVD